MKEETIVKLCEECLAELPKEIERCAVGHGNYVYIVELANRKVVVRCSEETGVYKDTIYWLEKLETIDIPADWSWKVSYVEDVLNRAKERIIANGCYFEPEKVDRLMEVSKKPELA